MAAALESGRGEDGLAGEVEVEGLGETCVVSGGGGEEPDETGSSELSLGEEEIPPSAKGADARPALSSFSPSPSPFLPRFALFPAFLLRKNPFPPPLSTPTKPLDLQSFLPLSSPSPIPLPSESRSPLPSPAVEIEAMEAVDDRASASAVARRACFRFALLRSRRTCFFR
jgi:hypothetical protein